MADHAARGKKALDGQNYEEAIKEYTAALKQSPTSPDYFIQRSTAYLRAKQNTKSLDDADHAVLHAQTRAKKELIVESQFRRGCALYSLERFGDAELVLSIVKRLKPDHKMADIWINKTTTSLKKLPADDEKRRCTVKETPEIDSVGKGVEGKEDGTITTGSTSTPGTNGASNTTSQLPINTSAASQQTPVDKIRHEWYQNTKNIYFTLLAKGVPKENAQVDIQERSLSITFPLVTGSLYALTLQPLFASVKPEECIVRVLPSKIEIILVKVTTGQKWAALEGDDAVSTNASPTTTAGDGDGNSVKRTLFTEGKPAGPAYPTSSRNGPKNWDKITDDAQEGTSGGLEEDEEGGDAANAFFKKLFKHASPEAQRAMMKSFTESNGTTLSTNWEEVSKGKVETLPPDGMEAKQWSK